mgnify:CR=1 FL=1
MRKVLLAVLVVALLASLAFADEAAQKFESITLNVPLEKNQIMLYENIPFNSGKGWEELSAGYIHLNKGENTVSSGAHGYGVHRRDNRRQRLHGAEARLRDIQRLR